MCAQRFQQGRKMHNTDPFKQNSNFSPLTHISLRERVNQLNYNIQQFIEEKQDELNELLVLEERLLENSPTK